MSRIPTRPLAVRRMCRVVFHARVFRARVFGAAVFCAAVASAATARAAAPPLLAGAAAVDITPRRLPVEVNGSLLSRSVGEVTGPLRARAVVLDRGGERVVIVVVDSCMIPRDVCDRIKHRAAAATGIPTERMLVAATHTHSAPCLMDHCLGAMRDEAYTEQMIPQVAEAVAQAHARLEPAVVGAAAVDAWEHTHCRRWIKRTDRIGIDPFGDRTVAAMMHPHPLTDYVGPAGPVDPAFTVLDVARPDGRPLAVVANFSMHYVGAEGISPDCFGPFAAEVEAALEQEFPGSGCVAMLSQGTSGDLHLSRYDPDATGPKPDTAAYHLRLAALAVQARRGIRHRGDAEIAMAQVEIAVPRRRPDAARLAWARRFDEPDGDRRATSQQEVYARQARWLHDHPQATLVLQAARIGDLAITALPNEVFGITGLKLKRQSPLPLTMNVGLANGAEGYIPPPEQHALGGYTTWPASTAGLDVEAEPQIVAVVLALLERVAGRPRRPLETTHGPAAEATLALGPRGYWRLDEIERGPARDSAGGHDGRYERHVAFHLPGVTTDPRNDRATAAAERPSRFSGPEINRAVHFAGGRLRARLPDLARDYSVSLWLWNGYPVGERPVTGIAFSRATALGADGDHLGLGGTRDDARGRLVAGHGATQAVGRTALALRTWHHVVLVRTGDRLRVHLDGRPEPEIDAAIPWTLPADALHLTVGAGGASDAAFEGKLDEVAVFDRPLSAAEIGRLYAASGRPAVSEQPPVSDQPPLDPAESLARLAVPPGFAVELVAAEPEVLDPVAFDWDSAGRLFVVEMADYPLGIDGAGRPGGRVRVLRDADGDGRYETATLFAEGLSFPTGCLTWRDGVIVTAAPEILFLADTDGDGRADRREVLVRGLTEGNQQLRANGLRWGLDNWVFVASGAPGRGQATVLELPRSGARLAIDGRDFRFRPDTGEIAAESESSQFGRERDDWGHWFGTHNATPVWHVLLPDRYADRNPFLPAGGLRQRLLPADATVHPALPAEKRYHSVEHAGHYTSGCGGMIHRDPGLFGPAETAAFICEPFHNLVQRVRVRDDGVSFAGAAVVEGGRDFLTSTDRWFRPVMVRTGPDGGLWVADMHRFMIEHPDWLPAAGQAELLPQYRRGDDRGRIYRIVRAGAARRRVPDLRGLDGPGLVRLLDDDNGFLRDKAHQMLLWRDGDDALPALEAAAAAVERPRASLHALAVLDGLGRLTAARLLPALAAAEPGLREHALRLAEPFLRAAPADPALLAAVVARADDPHPRVRFQAAVTLGESPEPAAGAALARLVDRHAAEPFMLPAVLSSAPAHLAAIAAAIAKSEPAVVDRAIGPLMHLALARGDRDAAAAMVATVGDDPKAAATAARAAAVGDALEAAKTDLPTLAARAEADDLAREAIRVSAVLDDLLAVAGRTDLPAAPRIAAALAASRSSLHRPRAAGILAEWLAAAGPSDDVAAVVRAVVATGADAAPPAFAAFWPRSRPDMRPLVLEAWASRDDWCLDLLDRVRTGELAAADLGAAVRARLVKHRAARVAARAAEVLGPPPAGRAEVIARYRPALAARGDAARGHAVYRRACAGCHRHGAEGRAVGPDVQSFAAQAPERLLTNILDPGADAPPGYRPHVCTLDSGEQLYGILTGDTAASIRLTSADGTERTIPRARIDALEATNVSLMPEGLEAVITPDEMADLIAFLRRPAPAE